MEDRVLETSSARPKRTNGSGLRGRVFLCDENVLVRDDLAGLIDRQHDLCCCGVAENLNAGREVLRDSNPDIILTELRFEGSESVERISQLAVEMEIGRAHV